MRISRELIEFAKDLRKFGTIAESLAAALVADDAFLVDEESGGPVGPFGVDAHLERHAIGGADGMNRIGENRKGQHVRPDANRTEHVPDPVRLVRVDGDELGVTFLDLLDVVAQLRELPVANGSGVAVDEDEHNIHLASVVGQLNLLAVRVGKREARSFLAKLGSVQLVEIKFA